VAVKSAGIVLYHHAGAELLVLLVHPGGPFWKNKDLGAWSIPKGEYTPDEDPASVALREFEEELGTRPTGPMRPLGTIVQRGGKAVTAFAMQGDLDTNAVQSNHFTMEWPPRSGKLQSFAEIDRAEWFSLPAAREKLLPSQCEFLDRLAALVQGRPRGNGS
jgi:predicted NUDIX family NTP pyrophosphohydrolase